MASRSDLVASGVARDRACRRGSGLFSPCHIFNRSRKALHDIRALVQRLGGSFGTGSHLRCSATVHRTVLLATARRSGDPARLVRRTDRSVVLVRECPRTVLASFFLPHVREDGNPLNPTDQRGLPPASTRHAFRLKKRSYLTTSARARFGMDRFPTICAPGSGGALIDFSSRIVVVGAS